MLTDEEEGHAAHAGAELQERLDRGHEERPQDLAEAKDGALQRDEGTPVLLVEASS